MNNYSMEKNTSMNEQLVDLQIKENIQADGPYFPNPLFLQKTHTDVNEWPYPRYFRGRPESSRPYFWAREAGYQKIIQPREIPTFQEHSFEPDTKGGCFQSACNTVFPCYYSNNINLPKKRIFTSP